MRSCVVVVCCLAPCAGGCASSSAPALGSGSAAIETGATADIAAAQGPLETSIVVRGTPTEVYSLVARGALGCWFAARGPLKATHVFSADAAPPAQGGQAEIVLHERDVSLRDQRGPRAFRVAFVSEAAGVRVGITVVRMAPALAEPMVQEVETWARGEAGCRLRAEAPPQAVAPLPPSAKTKPSRGALSGASTRP